MLNNLQLIIFRIANERDGWMGKKTHFWNVAFLQVSKYIAYDYDVYLICARQCSIMKGFFGAWLLLYVCDMCLMCTKFKVFLFSTQYIFIQGFYHHGRASNMFHNISTTTNNNNNMTILYSLSALTVSICLLHCICTYYVCVRVFVCMSFFFFFLG